MDDPQPLLPDYGGACLSSLTPALLHRREPGPSWLPVGVHQARQVVLLVVDGLGWEQLGEHAEHAPTLASGVGGPITSVAPTTTATALTSIATGRTPAEHGIVGYRLAVPGGKVLNVLRWQIDGVDARRSSPAPAFQPNAAFGGAAVPVVTRSEFAPTGFSAAHLAGSTMVGWRMPSTLVVEVQRLLEDGAPFVYAYYDGIDKVAHEHGLGPHYRAELRSVDRLVGDLIAILPAGAVLVLTSDHGQVQVDGPARLPHPDVLSGAELVSGEGRFRWFHVRSGALDDVRDSALGAHGHEAWVRTREEMVDEGWFGGPLSTSTAARLGDVALVAHAPVAYLDPADTGETQLVARHGSLTSAEMLVPLLVWAAL